MMWRRSRCSGGPCWRFWRTLSGLTPTGCPPAPAAVPPSPVPTDISVPICFAASGSRGTTPTPHVCRSVLGSRRLAPASTSSWRMPKCSARRWCPTRFRPSSARRSSAPRHRLGRLRRLVTLTATRAAGCRALHLRRCLRARRFSPKAAAHRFSPKPAAAVRHHGIAKARECGCSCQRGGGPAWAHIRDREALGSQPWTAPPPPA